jgi:hypothetical protein
MFQSDPTTYDPATNACSECRGFNLVHTPDSIVCSDCGIVAERNMISDGPEWRVFETDGTNPTEKFIARAVPCDPDQEFLPPEYQLQTVPPYMSTQRRRGTDARRSLRGVEQAASILNIQSTAIIRRAKTFWVRYRSSHTKIINSEVVHMMCVFFALKEAVPNHKMTSDDIMYICGCTESKLRRVMSNLRTVRKSVQTSK